MSGLQTFPTNEVSAPPPSEAVNGTDKGRPRRMRRKGGNLAPTTNSGPSSHKLPAWTGDPSAFITDAGWSAEYALTSGLSDTWRWYKAAGWL